jgi:Lrp/AsnC family transcriptional regulator, leucine-responsive regulatory protein
MAKLARHLQPLDERDKLLLGLLQENSRISNVELARQLNLTAPGLQKRLKKLEDNGYIDRYVTLVNREALGLDLLCFTQVTLIPGVDKIRTNIVLSEVKASTCLPLEEEGR